MNAAAARHEAEGARLLHAADALAERGDDAGARVMRRAALHAYLDEHRARTGETRELGEARLVGSYAIDEVEA